MPMGASKEAMDRQLGMAMAADYWAYQFRLSHRTCLILLAENQMQIDGLKAVDSIDRR
jgi:hypothetical protein